MVRNGTAKTISASEFNGCVMQSRQRYLPTAERYCLTPLPRQNAPDFFNDI